MRVVVAEDNVLLRDGVIRLLADHDIDVVAAVDHGDDLLAAVAEQSPDLALIDVRMPPTHTDEGVRAALDIRAASPAIGIIVFSQWVELHYARRLLTGTPSGVGYLLKDRIVSTESFIDALRRVADGGTALDPEVVAQLVHQKGVDEGLARLTHREHSVLALLAAGRSNQAIADELHLAIRSVEKVIASVFMKLDLVASSTEHRRVLAVVRYLSTTS